MSTDLTEDDWRKWEEALLRLPLHGQTVFDEEHRRKAFGKAFGREPMAMDLILARQRLPHRPRHTKKPGEA